MKLLLLPLLFISSLLFGQTEKETITFASTDGIQITADLYEINKTAVPILLCHQAGFSRGEYKEIAPVLNELGYNCMAIDQRSGNKVNGIENETFKLAKAKNLGTTYLDAEKDIIAAVAFLSNKYKQEIIIWGSSYSASLVLKVASENDNVKAVLSFSPGEYFKGKMVLANKIKGLDKPAFLTSSKKEGARTKNLFKVIRAENKIQYIPEHDGFHGSKALWSSKTGNESYWKSVKEFLKSIN